MHRRDFELRTCRATQRERTSWAAECIWTTQEAKRLRAVKRGTLLSDETECDDDLTKLNVTRTRTRPETSGRGKTSWHRGRLRGGGVEEQLSGELPNEKRAADDHEPAEENSVQRWQGNREQFGEEGEVQDVRELTAKLMEGSQTTGNRRRATG
jgi:hypothetical protein